MKSFTDLSSGQTISALVGQYDINRFVGLVRDAPPEQVYSLLADIGARVAPRIEAAGGLLIKYIGDAALFIFPDERADEAVRTLFDLKSDMERLFAERGHNNVVTFSLHFGEIVVGAIPPLAALDVFGEAVNTAFSLERGSYRGQVVISPQAFRRLNPATRKLFHKHTPPVVYLGGRHD